MLPAKFVTHVSEDLLCRNVFHFSLGTLFYKEFVGMCMNYLYTKFHMSKLSGH
jgi:hypothetical protein